jgi:2-polyprenyl-6-methoxyphenol hydroxylase-like FAD-dependent oxidoreductase
MLLARQGHDVVVVDRAQFPSDALSTHAIARGGIVQLARWGLLDDLVASGAPAIRSLTFHFGDGTALRKPVKDRAGVDHLLAPRRHVLDALLLAAAVDAGARFESGVTITDVVDDAGGRVIGVTGHDRDGKARQYRGRFVVGADGVRSRIARAVGAGTIDERPSETATHYAYVAGLDADGFEFHMGAGSFAGVFPTHDEEANVWICSPAAAMAASAEGREERFMALMDAAAPSLGRRVRAATLTSPVRGAVRLPNHVRDAAGRGWALVGDAGYHRDPITGHGITDAFRDAELLAVHLGRALRGEAGERAALAAYASERYRALAPIFEITCRLAQFPSADEFVLLQRELSRLIESEATALAARPAPPAAEPVAA